MKYVAAISDADILIHLAKADQIELLSDLFTEIIIPQYVLEKEIHKNAGFYLPVILKHINEGTLFRVVKREQDFALNQLAKPIIEDKRVVVGRGESECAGYAAALGIAIIISDNSSEFKWLSENVMLTYYDILALSVHFNQITQEEAIRKYAIINGILEHPSGKTFPQRQRETKIRIKENKWEIPLGLLK